MTQDASADAPAPDDRQFVETMWKAAGATFPPITAEVDGEPCRIVSVTARPAGSTYVNLTVGDEKRSLIAANHVWTRGQKEINDSAFYGVLTGAPADVTLQYEPAPKTLAEARAKDRAKAVGKRFFLRCKENDQAFSWRLVSGVEFGDECLDARSHFDWGEKQRFGFDLISEVVDAQTDENISIEEMREEIAGRAKVATTEQPASSNLKLVGLFLAAAIGAGALSYFLLDRFMAPSPRSARPAAPVGRAEKAAAQTHAADDGPRTAVLAPSPRAPAGRTRKARHSAPNSSR